MLQFKLGKRDTKIDTRTIQLRTILKELPPLPDAWHIDDHLPVAVPTPMFANDKLGDCVIAGRAHQTLRFECIEQQTCIDISDTDVIEEYYNEGCVLHQWLPLHVDRGLVLLDALNHWRRGWTIGGERYDVYAFAEIEPWDHREVMACVAFVSGIQAGIQVPSSVWKQFEANEVWDITTESRIEGGHCVYVNGYDTVGPKFVSWGRQCQMTWDFWKTFCDEAYGIVDNKNKPDSVVDIEMLANILRQITGEV